MKHQCLWRIVSRMPSAIRNKILQKRILRSGGETKSEFIREYMECYSNIKVGYGSYGCFINSGFKGGDSIGRYCSIAPEVQHFNANHPMERATMSPVMYQSIYNQSPDSYRLQRTHLSIGNDVWIGYRTIICPNVTKIGNGAIIGAGSVVTKDVEPYTIVAGNPARVIRKRFTDEQIELLEKSQWWELDVAQLQSLQNVNDDIPRFCDAVNKMRDKL